jgi:hypothetical protein
MLTERRNLFWLALLLGTLALVGVLALASIGPAREKAEAAEVQHGTGRPLAEALPISLRVDGFDPKEVVRPAGNYYLSVNNLSGERDLNLRIDRENGGRLQDAKTSRARPYWRQHIHLPPGTYLLTEAGHPDWVCRITVTAR